MRAPRWLIKIKNWLDSRNKRDESLDDGKIQFIDSVYDLGIDPEISRQQQIKNWCIAVKILSQDTIEYLRGNYGACSEELLIERHETLVEETDKIEEEWK